MTYFNPKIYCKQNLREVDRDKLEFAKRVAKDALKNAVECVKDDYAPGLSETLDKIQLEIIESFTAEVKEQLGYILQDSVVWLIDNYEETVEEVDEPEIYLYCAEKDEDEDDLSWCNGIDFTEMQ